MPLNLSRAERREVMQRVTATARAEFETWIRQIDPNCLIRPPVDQRSSIPVIVVSTTREVAGILAQQKSRPAVVKGVEPEFTTKVP